ncbi:Hypothetical_protein [Hexamita inflata]|uniref:Hypothetical_protein n=1 Tax=Hexamita inflata TaxID=28002 RepID=A0ABP1HH90_9EUKA
MNSLEASQHQLNQLLNSFFLDPQKSSIIDLNSEELNLLLLNIFKDFKQYIQHSKLVKHIVLAAIQRYSNSICLKNVLLAVQIELLNNSRDFDSINMYFAAIMKLNPISGISTINEQYPVTPDITWEMSTFLDNFQKCINQQDFELLKIILSQNNSNLSVIDIYGLVSVDRIKIKFPELKCNEDIQFLLQCLQNYKNMCSNTSIILQSNYADISTLTNDNLFIELQKVGFNAEQKQIDEFKSLKIEKLFNNQQLQNNRIKMKNLKELYNEYWPHTVPDSAIKDSEQNSEFINPLIIGNCNPLFFEQFKNACQKYTSMFDSVISTVDSNNKLTHFIGWQTHWETVIQFVRTHITGDSYQANDLLCVAGAPKSGKSSTMHLAAIFMMNFVSMIRPQQKNRLFCQNITKLIEIDCASYSGLIFIDKLKGIYSYVSAYIFQTQEQLTQVQEAVTVSKMFVYLYELFVNALCYCVVTWDDIQKLHITKSGNVTQKISEQDAYSFGCFIKSVMVSLNTPCQHIMTASHSEYLHSILKVVPVNGYSILKNQHVVITSNQDNAQDLQLVTQLARNTSTILDHQQALKTLDNNNLPRTCANLVQMYTVVSEPTLILTNVYVIIALENQITVFMLIITYSINSAVHFFFTSSFK